MDAHFGYWTLVIDRKLSTAKKKIEMIPKQVDGVKTHRIQFSSIINTKKDIKVLKFKQGQPQNLATCANGDLCSSSGYKHQVHETHSIYLLLDIFLEGKGSAIVFLTISIMILQSVVSVYSIILCYVIQVYSAHV